ncbi:MAG: glycoside hydrolase family 43 protein [Spirochaetia bacterium]|nr:glycoside hydrolase family 43 protein [Spirochaetia bacterium]
MTFANPVNPGFYPDPSICRRGDDYFMVHSSFEYFPAVPLFHSRDLVNWQCIGHVLDRLSQLDLHARPSSCGIFAPSIRYHDHVFYMITTDVRGSGHFFVTTEDPFGSWSDPIHVEGSGFDPDLFFDDDGRIYFVREDIQGHGIRMWEIDISNGRLLGDEMLIWDGFEDRLCEGPHIYRIGSWYYLLAAEGGTYRGHMITCARSRSVTGPYLSCPHNPLLTHRHMVLDPIQSLGHGDLLQAHDGSWWLMCLGTRPSGAHHYLGRETFLFPVTWDENQWPHIDPMLACGSELPAFASEQHLDTSVHEDFSHERVCHYLCSRRTPISQIAVHDRKNHRLQLLAPEYDPESIDPFSFIGLRIRDPQCTLTVELASVSMDAGLMILMDEKHYYSLSLNAPDSCCLKKVLGDHICDIRYTQIEKRPVHRFSVSLAHDLCSFSLDGEPVGDAEAKLISSEVADSFTGLTAGIYHAQNGIQEPLVCTQLVYEALPSL